MVDVFIKEQIKFMGSDGIYQTASKIFVILKIVWLMLIIYKQYDKAFYSVPLIMFHSQWGCYEIQLST